MLKDDDMFDPIEGNSDSLEFEPNEVFGPEVNNASFSNIIAGSNISNNNITDEDKPMALGFQILFQWERRKEEVNHDYYIVSWAISVMPEVWDNVVGLMTGVHHDEINHCSYKTA